jgi:hypothetical protein
MANTIAVPGTNVPAGAAVSPGGAQGVQGIQGSVTPSADALNIATLGSDSRIYVPDPTPVITSVRLRSFNAIGNPSFEVDSRQVGSLLTNPASGGFIQDRWQLTRTGTMTVNTQQTILPTVNVPGTTSAITSRVQALTLTTQQASLGASDFITLNQYIEGPMLRELINGTHSISLLVSSTVAPLEFSIALRDSPTTQSLVKLCTITTGSTWTLVTLPNIPVWPTANFSLTPGNVGYIFSIVLSAGSTITAPAADVWQSGNYIGAPGMDNWASKAVNSVFYCAFIQHEPGPNCTTLIDKPFSQSLDECLRYYQKSYRYSEKPGVAIAGGPQFYVPAGGANPITQIIFPKPMAKDPTVTGYSPSTGAINNVRDTTNNADRAIGGPLSPTEKGFNGFTVTGGSASIWQANFHYTADTGF